MSYWHVIGGFAAFLALVWLIVRQAWISRVTVTIEAEAVSVAMPHARTKRIRWADLATSQYIAPQLASLQLLMLRPEFGKRAGRLPGFDARSQLRRVVTQSPELLLIARDGVFLLIPLAAVTSFEWSQLRAAAQRHSPSPEVYRAAIEQARECEEAAQERMIATQWAEAVPLYRQAAVHWERSGRIEQVNRTLENLATCLVHLGQYTAAAGVFQRALSLCEALEDEAGAAFVHNGLGGVEAALGEAGNLEAALAHLRAARRIHAASAHGRSYAAQEARFFEARTVSNQASVQERLAILKRIDDPAAAGIAIAECERLANEALALLQPLSTVPLPDLHGQRANLHGTLARCAALRGEWDRAATLFAAAADESQERAILADRALWARAELMRSRAPGLDPVVSRRLIHEAMRRIDEAVRMSPLQGSQDDLLEIITTRGGLFWEMQRWDEAARDYDYALRLIDDRPHNFSRPAERAALRRRFHELYPRLVEANLRLALQSPHNAEQAIAWAFQASERFKSTSLAEILASEAMLGLLADETRRELEEAQRRQREAMLEGESLRSVTDDGTRGAIWRRMWDADERLKRAWETAMAELPPDVVRRGALSIDEVIAKLPDAQTAILQLSLCEGGLAAFLLCRALPIAQAAWLIPGFRRGAWPDAVSAAEELSRKIAAANESESPLAGPLYREWEQNLPALLDCLRDAVFHCAGSNGSIVDTLERLSIARLAIVAEGVLARLPLHCGVPEGVRVTLAPSCGVLLDATERAIARPADILIVDNPDPARPLYAAETEGAMLAEVSERTGLTVMRLSRDDARGDTVMDGMKRASLVHYAGHALSDRRSVWESKLRLCDGPLTAWTLFRESAVRKGAVAFINGCSSGVAPQDDSGEVAGLPAAFLALGYSTVISTLWDVPERTPVAVMDAFYGAFLRGRPAPEALGAAVDRLRRSGRADLADDERARGLEEGSLGSSEDLPPSHPVHWAGYVLWGALWTAGEARAAAGQAVAPRPSRTPLDLPLLQGAPPEMLELIREANRLAEAKEFHEARPLYERCMKEWGETWGRNRLLLSALGHVETELGHYEAAVKLDEEALQKDLNSASSHYTLGCSLMDAGEAARARACFETAIALDPGYFNAYCNLGMLARSAGEAVRALREAAQLQPDDAAAQAALERWEAIDRDPRFELGPQRLYWAMQAREQSDWKHLRLNLALARELPLTAQQQAIALGTEAEMHRELGDVVRSVACMEASLELEPAPPAMWNTLSGRYYMLAVDPRFPAAESKEFLRRAIEAGRRATVVGDYSRPRRNLALALKAAGDHDGARHELERAEEMAKMQIANGPQGPLICGGCPTRGKDPAECHDCLRACGEVRKDLELAHGNYRV